MSEGENEAFKKSLAWEGRRRTEYCYCRDRTSGNGGRWKKSYMKFQTKVHEEFIKHARTLGCC